MRVLRSVITPLCQKNARNFVPARVGRGSDHLAFLVNAEGGA